MLFDTPSPRSTALNLRKVVLFSLLLSHGALWSVLGDETPIDQLIHDAEDLLGIEEPKADRVPTIKPRPTPSRGFPITTTTSSRTTTSTTTTTASSSTSIVSTTTTAPASQPTNTGTPAVFAHFIVGNTYNYNIDKWLQDIVLAASKGIDAFALNVGADSWESTQVDNAFSAAYQYNAVHASTPFKLFMSFDMASLPCKGVSDGSALQKYISKYANNTSQFKYNGRVFVSTFAGQDCTFGRSDGLDSAWKSVLRATGTPAVWFVPTFFVDPATFPSLSVIDGMFHWNSGWPMGNYNITFAPDLSYISKLGNSKTYMAAVSPWFFTHYGPDTYNKNFIYRGDDWLVAQRWEMLVANRTSVPFTQIVTWNDFGESHYVGPIEGEQPMSQQWVNGFDHQGWLELMQYYIAAYKTGSYPTITKDRVFMWARPFPASANAPDSVGRPTNWQWTQDYLWVETLLTAPANVTISCGPTSLTLVVPAGASKLKLKLSSSCSPRAQVVRNTTTVLDFAPSGFTFNTQASSYNFNAYVAASP